MRSVYANESSPSNIEGFETEVADQDQYKIRADAGGEGGVVINSALSLTAGLFPASEAYNTTLADGTEIVAPMGGYQTIPIETIEPDNDISMEGWTQCGKFAEWTQQVYKSDAYQKMAEENADFLAELPRYMDGRPTSFDNMWNIHDFLNVNSIHDPRMLENLPEGYLARARALTNFHQFGVFSSPQLDGIGNIAGRTVLPLIVNDMFRIANSSDPLKLAYNAGSYKPFISLFKMTGAADENPELRGFVNYAGTVAFEVREGLDGGEATVRLNFKNGTNAEGFTNYSWFNGTTDVPLSQFRDYFAPSMVTTTAQWCDACSNSVDRGCAALEDAKLFGASMAGREGEAVSALGAGFIGAGVSIAVFATALGVLYFLGLLVFGRRKPTITKGYSIEDKA